MTFAVSVIIPIHNAATYVTQTVETALAQPETAEVILVEDGSTDDSLTVCKRLAAACEQVRLYQHPGGQNLGPSASRNLGILNSHCPYVAFLDADDYYLPERFRRAKDLFAVHSDIDGVCEAVGIEFEDAEAEKRWHATKSYNGLTMVRQHVEPEALLGLLTAGTSGHIVLNGMVVRRSLFEKTGLFDASLWLHEDTVMINKMAAVGRLVIGCLDKPVAIRRVHAHNRSSLQQPWYRLLISRTRAHATTWRWSRQHLDSTSHNLLLDGFLNHTINFGPTPGNRLLARLAAQCKLDLLALFYPMLLTEARYWQRQAALRRIRDRAGTYHHTRRQT